MIILDNYLIAIFKISLSMYVSSGHSVPDYQSCENAIQYFSTTTYKNISPEYIKHNNITNLTTQPVSLSVWADIFDTNILVYSVYFVRWHEVTWREYQTHLSNNMYHYLKCTCITPLTSQSVRWLYLPGCRNYLRFNSNKVLHHKYVTYKHNIC